MYDEVIVANDENVPIGHLYFRRSKGLEWQEFKYSGEWIENGREIDPEIPLYEGIHRAASYEFGCFSDAAPDSWGRALLKNIITVHHKYHATYLRNILRTSITPCSQW